MMQASNAITVELTLEDVKAAIKKYILGKYNNLQEHESYSINFTIQEVGGDPMGRYPGHNEVIGVSARFQLKKES
jgi:hypothetical protein